VVEGRKKGKKRGLVATPPSSGLSLHVVGCFSLQVGPQLIYVDQHWIIVMLHIETWGRYSVSHFLKIEIAVDIS
jgi:hypothetical protein